mgnify:CR=1 FL=1
MSDVGYGKPPLHSRFQKGKSGNAKGRPKGSCNTLKLLNDVLEQKITITQDGKQVKISKKLAMLTQLVNAAVKGEIKAIAALFPYLLQIDLKEEEKQQALKALSSSDQSIVENFIKKIKENGDGHDR